MYLTDKAYNDFENWLYKNHIEYYRMAWGTLPEIAQIAMVIQWLDSININVEIGVYPSEEDGIISYTSSMFGKFGGWDSDNFYPTRIEALKEIITKVNIKYNECSNN